MGRRRKFGVERYVTVREAKERLKRASSSSGAKRPIYYTIGGRGFKPHLDITASRCASNWNPGRALPSKQYKHV